MKLFFRSVLPAIFICLALAYDKCRYQWLSKDDEAKCCSTNILELHNDYRSLVQDGLIDDQPKAENLGSLAWNNSLARTAQKVANTCNFEHLEINETDFDSVGQNLYQECSYEFNLRLNWTKAIDYWFNEHKIYTYPNNATEENGHYTQMVWAESEYLGCACTFFLIDSSKTNKTDKHGRHRDLYCKLYVCHYGPGGNVMGEAPYKTDESDDNSSEENASSKGTASTKGL